MIEITAPRKNSIAVESPVIFAAGTVGFDGSPYRKLLALDKFGGLITPPLSLAPRLPANGPRIVEVPAGFLMHTGLPNPGIRRALQEYAPSWKKSVLAVIVHLIAESADAVGEMASIVEQDSNVAGIELGLHDQVTMRELRNILKAARDNTDLPILARLPLYNALMLGEVAQHSGADALVVAAPPRGTERQQSAGRLVGGRLYGPALKAQALRMVGRVAQFAEVPVIGCGGIHTPDDARDFITAGATAVQLDTIVWVNPKMAEIIARNLGGTELTRTAGAMADEWEPGMGDTLKIQRRPHSQEKPADLPETSPDTEETTRETAPSEERPDWFD